VVEKIDANSSQLAAASNAIPNVKALVAAVMSGQVVLNQGSASGYRPGLKVAIERVTQKITDPATGKVIREISQPVGLVELVDVDAQSSVGRIVKGSGFRVGDTAKPTE
jgi:hypothetical protein